MTQQEQAILNVVINGKQAISTFQDLNKARNEAVRLQKTLKEGTPEYAKQAKDLQQLNAAYAVWRKEIYSTGEANKGFFSDWKAGFEEVKRIAEGVTIGTLISMGVRGAIEGVRNLISGAEEAYTEAQKTQTQLQTVLKSTGGVAGESRKQLEQYQQTLMDQTGVDDDVIAKGEEMLLTFTNIRGKIYEQALPAIVDMTSALNQGNVTMEGIQATAIQVGKALNDPINGATALKKVGVTLDDQQKQQIKTFQDSNRMMDAQAVILKELQKEFGGTAKAIADTDVGKLQAEATAWGNLSENFGKFIVSAKGTLADVLNPLLNFLTAATNTGFSKAMEADSAALEANIRKLQNANTSHAERIDLINKLKETYPGYLSQINSEKVSNDQLLPILAKINTQLYDKRQNLSKFKQLLYGYDDLADQDEVSKIADKRLKSLGDFHKATNKELDAMIADQQKKVKSHQSFFDKNQKQLEAYKNDHYLKYRLGTDEAQDLDHDTKTSSESFLGQQTALTALLDEKENRSKKAAYSGPSQGDQDKLKREREAAETKRQALYDIGKKLNADLASLDADELNNTLAKNDKEIAAAGKKYDDIIKKEHDYQVEINKSKVLTPTQKKAETVNINNTIDKATADKTAAVAALRVKQEADMVEKIKQLNAGLTVAIGSEFDKQKVNINKFYDGLVQEAGNNAEQISIINKNRAESLAQVDVNEKRIAEEEKKKIDDEYATISLEKDISSTALIKKKYDDEIKALKEKHSKEFQETKEFQLLLKGIKKNEDEDLEKDAEKKRREKYGREADYARTLSDTVFTIWSGNRKQESDEKISQLEKQKNAELSQANLTESQKKAINDKYDKLEKAEKLKAFKAEQKAAIAQTVINGAIAIIKDLATLGPVAGPIAAIGTGIVTAAQIAVIAAQKPPQYREGGVLPGGPTHAAGGMNVIDPLGQVVANIEGGEPILSRRTYAANSGLVNALLSSGGQTLDYDRVMQAVTTTRSAGLNFGSSNATVSSQGSDTANSNAAEMAELRAMLKATMAMVQATDSKPVIQSTRLFNDHQVKLLQISEAVNA